MLHLFHIGALCSKTLDGLGRVKKSMKKFDFHFFVLLLTQTMRKSCPQSEIFNLGGQYYGLGQSIVIYSAHHFCFEDPPYEAK